MKNLTALPDEEFVGRLLESFAKAAKDATNPDISGWYARECYRIAYWLFVRQCDEIVRYTLIQLGCEPVRH